ncbi:MAG TPA: AI-2E family transporter [Gemmatimonadaceae bacterium]|nr:AI-2E family transporter [Gemmatimonadaceae bacterium]
MTATSPAPYAPADVYRRRTAGVLVLLSGIALLIACAPLVGGILSALVLAVAFDTPYRRLAARIGPKRAAGITVVACTLLLFIPALAIGHAALTQLRALDVRESDAIGAISSIFGERAGDVRAAFDRLAANISASVSGLAMSFVGGVASGALNTFVAFLFLYFLLLSSDDLWARVRAYLPFSEGSSDQLRRDLYRVIMSTLLGTLSSAVLQGVSVGVGILVTGLPAPTLWGVVAGFSSMVPLMGTALVWVPAAILLLVRHQTGAMLLIVLFGWLLPTTIDQVVRARVSHRLGHVHPLTALIGALIGVRLFGIMGVVAGPLMIAVFFELLRLYERDYGSSPDGIAPSAVHS